MEDDGPKLRAWALAADGLRTTLRPPFRGLVALSLFVSVVSSGAAPGPGEANLLFALLLAAVSAYAQIACSLAAAAPDAERSADAWFVAALRRRCFWRYVVTELLVLLAVVAGLLVLVVGAFVVGGVVALAPSAAALERRTPLDALRRGTELGRAARRPLAVLFGLLVLAPSAAAQLAYSLGASDPWHPVWLFAASTAVVLTLAGTIALARAFVLLGGRRVRTPREAAQVAPVR